MGLIKRKRRNRLSEKGRLIVSASFLLISVASTLLMLKYYRIYQNEQKVQQELDKFFQEQQEIKNEEPEEKDVLQTETVDEKVENTNINDYILVLDIPNLNLMRGVYSKDSKENDVNKNVKILKESDLPDKINGNVILVAHSGTSNISYFKNLHKLVTNDIAYIHYAGKVYTYKLVNTYDIEKTGEAPIIRNSSKNTLTLITCRRNTNLQTVFIFEIVEDEKYE